jgi:orotate phosphoribosyltransferase
MAGTVSFGDLPSYDPERLVVGLYDRQLLQFGDFSWTLKSKRKSPIYYNQRPITSVDYNLDMSPNDQRVLVQDAVNAYAQRVQRSSVEHLYGIPQATTHLIGMVGLATGRSTLWGRVGGKDYGAHASIEGTYYEGQRVLQLDDVVTNADSKIESAHSLDKAGLQTLGFVVMLDRQEGDEKATGMETVRQAGYEIEAIVVLSQAVEILKQNGKIGGQEIGWVQRYHEGLRADGIATSFSLD